MTEPMRSPAARRRAAGAGLLNALLVLAVAGCAVEPSASPSVPATATPTAAPTDTPSPTDTPPPTATPTPPLSLAPPAETDPRRIRIQLAPEVPIDGGGRIMVTVTNLSDERVAELVLRWPTPLRETLFLAPFAPSQQRIADGGPPLWQEWTKWVEGPGERGEPAGTTSLGWGPFDPGATLTIPILVTRNAPGEVAFDLQVLAGEATLTLEEGAPALLRVQIP